MGDGSWRVLPLSAFMSHRRPRHSEPARTSPVLVCRAHHPARHRAAHTASGPRHRDGRDDEPRGRPAGAGVVAAGALGDVGGPRAEVAATPTTPPASKGSLRFAGGWSEAPRPRRGPGSSGAARAAPDRAGAVAGPGRGPGPDRRRARVRSRGAGHRGRRLVLARHRPGAARDGTSGESGTTRTRVLEPALAAAPSYVRSRRPHPSASTRRYEPQRSRSAILPSRRSKGSSVVCAAPRAREREHGVGPRSVAAPRATPDPPPIRGWNATASRPSASSVPRCDTSRVEPRRGASSRAPVRIRPLAARARRPWAEPPNCKGARAIAASTSAGARRSTSEPEEAAVVGHLGAGAARPGDPDRNGHPVAAAATVAVLSGHGAHAGVHQGRRADRAVDGGPGEDVVRVGAASVPRDPGRRPHGHLAQPPDQGDAGPCAGPALVHSHRPAGDRCRAHRAENREQAQAVDVRVMRAHHHALGRAAGSHRHPVVVAGGETAQHTRPVTLDDGSGHLQRPALSARESLEPLAQDTRGRGHDVGAEQDVPGQAGLTEPTLGSRGGHRGSGRWLT